MKLNKAHFRNNPFWDSIKEQLLCNIDNCRIRNDSDKLTYEATQELRGRIAAFKAVLALEEKAPE